MALEQVVAPLRELVSFVFEPPGSCHRKPGSPSTLYRLPVEIRHEVFRLCLENSPRASTPLLLVALRPDRLLYHEAFAVFCGTNRLAIRPDNLRDIDCMPKSALRQVLCAQISDGMYFRGDGLDVSWGSTLYFQPFIVAPPVSRMEHLRSLVVTNHCISQRDGEWLQYMRVFVRHYVLMFRELGHLAIVTDWAGKRVLHKHRKERAALIRILDRALGVKAVVLRRRNEPFVRHWEWRLKPPRTMTWTDELAFRSIPWTHIGIVYQFVTRFHRHAFWRTYGTTHPGLMCRRLAWECLAGKSCLCAKIPAPPYRCHHPNPHPAGFSCLAAPNGLDSFGRYTFTRL